MTDWLRVITHGWPSVPKQMHHVINKDVVLRAYGGDEGKARSFIAAASKRLRDDGILAVETVVVLPVNGSTLPTINEIVSRKNEIEDSMAEGEAKRFAVKVFSKQWPAHKIVEYWNDPEKRAELEAALTAQGG